MKALHISNRIKLVIASGVVIAGTSGAAAFNLMQPTTAEPVSPTDIKVQEHEARLDKNEADIADTKDRVTQVEQKVDENSQAVTTVKERVTVIEKAASQPQSSSEPSVSASPTPAPVKTVNPRLIVGVSVEDQLDQYGKHLLWTCRYSLESGRIITNNQGDWCSQPGEEISADLAGMYGIK